MATLGSLLVMAAVSLGVGGLQNMGHEVSSFAVLRAPAMIVLPQTQSNCHSVMDRSMGRHCRGLLASKGTLKRQT